MKPFEWAFCATLLLLERDDPPEPRLRDLTAAHSFDFPRVRG